MMVLVGGTHCIVVVATAFARTASPRGGGCVAGETRVVKAQKQWWTEQVPKPRCRAAVHEELGDPAIMILDAVAAGVYFKT